jgi:uncharacterized protein (TIGR02284 family)
MFNIKQINMENTKEKVVSVTCELAQFVKDGKVGYKKAAEETKDMSLKAFCEDQSQKRAMFLSELNSIIIRNGGDPETSDTIKGKIYHQWMDIKAALTSQDDEAIIGSCVYGEEWALKAYDDALESKDLPADVRMTFMKQRETCHNAYVELKKMKEQYHHH